MRPRRILVAMSGGVDSSVVAGLLHEAGHEVIGVTLQLYDHGAATVGKKGACCAGQDIYDARRVADRLGIPHYVIDAEARFRQAVIEDFADSYASGRDSRALRALQPDGQVHRPAGWRSRPGLPTRWRPAITCAGSMGRRGRAAPGRTRPARPELVPVRHHPRPARALRCSRWATCRTRRRTRSGRRRGWGWRWRTSPTARTSASCRMARYDAVVARLRPDAAAPGEIVTRGDGAVLGRHAGIGGYTVGQAPSGWPCGRHRGRQATGGWCWRWIEPRPGGGWWSGRAAAARGSIVRLREVNWLVAPKSRWIAACRQAAGARRTAAAGDVPATAWPAQR